MIMTKIWYLKRDNFWVSCGSDFKLYKWNIKTVLPENTSAQIGRAYVVHND